MAVLYENDYGWFVCCKTFFDSIYEHSELENSSFVKVELRKDFFDIKTPFLMNSQCHKYATEHIQSDKLKKKKTKRKMSNMPQFDSEVEVFIKKGTNLLVAVAQTLGFLEVAEVSAEEWFENNSKARRAALEVLNYSNTNLDLELCCDTATLHPVIRKFGNDYYLLPPESSFQLCDINDFFQSVAEKYDLIVIDPPWINKSVKRKKSYHQLKYDILKDLPIEKLTNPGCLIVVWVTNSSSTTTFVKKELFPRCNVIFSTVWHWSKVTVKGSFVYPIESLHKKPFENLILGRVAYDCDASLRPSKEIESEKLIVSIPSSIHSNKPPLVEILKSYLIPEARCIELFARSLLPGWKSVGNEVLKLQNMKLFNIMK